MAATVRVVYNGPFTAADMPDASLYGIERGVPVEVGNEVAQQVVLTHPDWALTDEPVPTPEPEQVAGQAAPDQTEIPEA